jgi:hypothetical protein
MAIFRGGKRVGPFDIRIGFPRDKSMNNIDGDVRLRQHANTENTIGRFRASMARAEGYARPARFAVRIFPPINLAKIAANEYAGGDAGGEFNTGPPKINKLSPDAITMQQLYTQMGQQVNIHCDSVSMPGIDLQTQSVQYGSEPARDMVQTHDYPGATLNASFYADKYLRERHFFELWQRMAVNSVTHKANYYDTYIGKMHIYQLGAMDGEGGQRDYPTYAIEATEVYPATIAAVEYNYATKNQVVKINIGFNYKEWHNLATDSIGGMEFGASQQTLHDVRSADKGLFGKLPPELQRAGRNIINQAKTQLPIGRLTRGKIFPPFT